MTGQTARIFIVAENRGWYLFQLLRYFKARAKRADAARRHARTQRVLRQLDAHLLRDIGVDPADVGKPSEEAERFMARIRLKYPGIS